MSNIESIIRGVSIMAALIAVTGVITYFAVKYENWRDKKYGNKRNKEEPTDWFL